MKNIISITEMGPNYFRIITFKGPIRDPIMLFYDDAFKYVGLYTIKLPGPIS